MTVNIAKKHQLFTLKTIPRHKPGHVIGPRKPYIYTNHSNPSNSSGAGSSDRDTIPVNNRPRKTTAFRARAEARHIRNFSSQLYRSFRFGRFCRKLDIVKHFVQSVLFDQFVMATRLDNPAVVNDNDTVSIFYG